MTRPTSALPGLDDVAEPLPAAPLDVLTFGFLIRRARQARSLSKAELERRIGRAAGYVSRTESGELGAPPRPTVLELAKALGLDPDELWRIAAYERDPDVFKAGFRAARESA